MLFNSLFIFLLKAFLLSLKENKIIIVLEIVRILFFGENWCSSILNFFLGRDIHVINVVFQSIGDFWSLFHFLEFFKADEISFGIEIEASNNIVEAYEILDCELFLSMSHEQDFDSQSSKPLRELLVLDGSE